MSSSCTPTVSTGSRRSSVAGSNRPPQHPVRSVADSRNPKVMLAYVHPNEVSASFHACLNGLIMWDASHHAFLIHEHGQLAVRCGTDGLVQAREKAVEGFLSSDADVLLWVDSDMGFA